MLKAENPASVKRCDFMRKCRELKLSSNTEAKITVCLMGKTEQEKEELAEKLLTIITECETDPDDSSCIRFESPQTPKSDAEVCLNCSDKDTPRCYKCSHFPF